MKNQEQLIQEKLSILIYNFDEMAKETAEQVSTLGNFKVSHKGVKVSLNDLFNFRKMDAKGFIGYIYLTKQNKEVFGELSQKDIEHLLTEVISEKVMNSMVKRHFNSL